MLSYNINQDNILAQPKYLPNINENSFNYISVNFALSMFDKKIMNHFIFILRVLRVL